MGPRHTDSNPFKLVGVATTWLEFVGIESKSLCLLCMCVHDYIYALSHFRSIQCHLCEELIDEILERLPPKSLLRFRSVSKSWCHRISSGNFIRNHTFRCVTTATWLKPLLKHQIHFSKDGVEFSYALDPTDVHSSNEVAKFSKGPSQIVGSCFGILCLNKITVSPSVSLWNPSIRRKVTVPDYPFGNSDVAYGFGFDPTTDDYKIAGLSCGDVQSSYVYSLKTNSWTEIQLPTTPFSEVMTLACFVDGALHWAVKCESNDIPHYCIMTLDLRTHVFGMISLPNPSWVTQRLLIIKDSLAVISSDGYESRMWIRIEEDNNDASWSKALKITSFGVEDSQAYNPFTFTCGSFRFCLHS
ncbi:F-box/kelch-repeat protein-like protein [Tanacetum coccineum]